jgi:hypothetical protein
MAVLSQKSLMKKWLLLWAIINCCIIFLLHINVISPLSWFGKISYVLLFMCLLTVLSSLFLISHEVNDKGSLLAWRKKAFNIVTFWSIIGTLVLLFEVFFRLLPVYDTLALNPAVKFFWPDYVSFPLNNLGYRDRDFVLNRNPHTYRIIVVGDSFTEGAGCRREETWGRVLERELNRRLQSTACHEQVEVYNLGICGANSVEEVALIFREVPVLKPDLIILAYCLNDPETNPHDIKVFDPPPWVTAMHKIFLEELHSYAYYWFFTKFTLFPGQISSWNEYCQAIHRTDYHGWKEASEAFSELSKFVKVKDIDFFTIIFPDFYQKDYSVDFRRIHKQVDQMIREKDLEVVDLLDFYENISKDLSVFAFSRCDQHPNLYAHDLLGKYLAKSVWDRQSFKQVREHCGPDK